MKTYSDIRKQYGFPLKLSEVLEMLDIVRTEACDPQCLESVCGEAKAAITMLMDKCETGEQFADICLAEQHIVSLTS